MAVEIDPPFALSRGLFFVFEGLDGAGKTTQAFLLKDRLEASGYPVLYVKEPTDGPWGRKIREIASSGRAHLTLEEELEFFIKDREDDVRFNIAPALAAKKIVIGDRYFHSNIAYQSALGLDMDLIRRLNAHFPSPDLVFFLEITPEFSQVRITQYRGQTANQGYEQVDFLRKVKSSFDLLTDANLVRLDGVRSIDLVATEIWSLVEPYLK